MSSQKIIIGVLVGFILIGGSFYGGMKYDQSRTMSERQARFTQFAGGGGGPRGGGIRAAGGGFTGGEIISKDDKSITVKLRDGGSKIIFLSDTTQIMKSATSSRDALSVGAQVTVMGSANSDGSIAAGSIQVR